MPNRIVNFIETISRQGHRVRRGAPQPEETGPAMVLKRTKSAEKWRRIDIHHELLTHTRQLGPRFPFVPSK